MYNFWRGLERKIHILDMQHIWRAEEIIFWVGDNLLELVANFKYLVIAMEKPDNDFPEIHTITYSLIIVLLPPE